MLIAGEIFQGLLQHFPCFRVSLVRYRLCRNRFAEEGIGSAQAEGFEVVDSMLSFELPDVSMENVDQNSSS